MVNKYDSIMIWSENWRELAKWYQDMFHLEVLNELNLPDDTGVTFNIGNGESVFWVGYHDQVHGQAKDPYRIMVGFNVDSVTRTYAEMKAKGAEFIAAPKVSPTGDYMVATVKDPEGNIIQLFGDLE